MKRLFCSFTANLALSCLAVSLGQKNQSHVQERELVEKGTPPVSTLLLAWPKQTEFFIPDNELKDKSPFTQPAKSAKKIGKIQRW